MVSSLGESGVSISLRGIGDNSGDSDIRSKMSSVGNAKETKEERERENSLLSGSGVDYDD